MIDKIREAIRKEKKQWLNSDNWAVYINPQDRRELIGDWGGPKIASEGAWGADEFRTVDDVAVLIDHYVDSPVVLPKDAGMMPSDLKFQDNPPLHLVKQLVDPTEREDSESDIPRIYTLKDTFWFEVRSVEYKIFIDQLSTDLHCPKLHTMLAKVVGSEADWGFERRSSSWVFRRQFDVEEEVKKFPFSRRIPSDELALMDIVEDFAIEVVQTIGGETSWPIYGRREVMSQEPEPQMAAPEAPISCSSSYETETERVKVGKKIYKLGRFYVQ